MSHFFVNDTATTEFYTLSLHDALPIYRCRPISKEKLIPGRDRQGARSGCADFSQCTGIPDCKGAGMHGTAYRNRCHRKDRKSTRLNSSHANISYAVFCLKEQWRWHRLP